MKIYRLRPSCDNTLDELENEYLWFSKPIGFNDTEDANIVSFVDNNAKINEILTNRFGEFETIKYFALNIGICCFTKELPQIKNWRRFPKCRDGIAVEFDKKKLLQYFGETYGLGDCFKDVDYLEKPTIFKNCTEHDIVWEENEKGIFYKSLNEISNDPKLRDKFFLKMFTRLSVRYINQNEQRILLNSNFIIENDKQRDKNGYKIKIPKCTIRKIYYTHKTPSDFVSKIKKLEIEMINV